MKDDDLRRRLKVPPIPPPDATAASRALSHALMALQGARATRTPARSRIALLWGGVCAFALVIIAGFIGERSENLPDRGADLQMIREMVSLFDQQFSAVVEKEGAVSILLARNAAPPDRPIRVLLRRGKEIVRILSYSGREVCLELDGENFCLDILTTASGKVMMLGESFVWDPQHPAPLAGYHIEVEMLDPAS